MGTTIILSITAILITAAVCFAFMIVRLADNSNEKVSARLREARDEVERLTARLNAVQSDNASLRSENEAFRKSDSELKQYVTNLKKQLRELRDDRH